MYAQVHAALQKWVWRVFGTDNTELRPAAVSAAACRAKPLAARDEALCSAAQVRRRYESRQMERRSVQQALTHSRGMRFTLPGHAHLLFFVQFFYQQHHRVRRQLPCPPPQVPEEGAVALGGVQLPAAHDGHSVKQRRHGQAARLSEEKTGAGGASAADALAMGACNGGCTSLSKACLNGLQGDPWNRMEGTEATPVAAHPRDDM